MRHLFTVIFCLVSLQVTGQNMSGQVFYTTTYFVKEHSTMNPILAMTMVLANLPDTIVKRQHYYFSDNIKQMGQSELPIPSDSNVAPICRIPNDPLKIFDIQKDSLYYAGQDLTDGIEQYFKTKLSRQKNIYFTKNDTFLGRKCHVFSQIFQNDTISYWIAEGLLETMGLTFLDKNISRTVGAVLKIKTKVRTIEVDSIVFKEVTELLESIDFKSCIPAPPAIEGMNVMLKKGFQFPKTIFYDTNGQPHEVGKKDSTNKVFVIIVIPEKVIGQVYRQPFLNYFVKKMASNPKIKMIGLFKGSVIACEKFKKEQGYDLPFIPDTGDWLKYSGLNITPDFIIVDTDGHIKYIGSQKSTEESRIWETTRSLEEVMKIFDKAIFD